VSIKKDPWFRNRLIRDGIYKAIHEDMRGRPEVYIMGEGSHMKVHFDAKDIEKEFGDRIITLPICEDANSNFAVGMTLAGLVPIVDVISSDFLYRTMDAICNTMAKSAAVGRRRTMIVRAEFMTGGPTSGQRIEALFTHIPGLRVAVPSNPQDAYGLMREALLHKGVTIFFEDRMIADTTTPPELAYGSFDDGFNGARVSSLCADNGEVVVVSYGITCRLAENALRGTNTTVIDLRTLYPLDMMTIYQRLNLSRRLLVVEPDVQFMGIGAEICADVAENLPGCMIRRLGAPRATIPASRELHDEIMPSVEAITAAVEEMR
jgi:pyruvate/2-oxoglutarate/acetoin dehydrogenase E1 component